jgi:flap endonuclease-1
MGVDLGDLFGRSSIAFGQLSGKVVAVDAHNTLYQFLSVIRQPDGTPLMDSSGRITSHLSGLIYRTTSMMEAGMRPVFVFDGKPPGMKEGTIKERRQVRAEAYRRWEEAKAAGSPDAFKYAQASSRLTGEILEDAKNILGYMGVPCVQAPSEGEAQTAFMVRRGDAYCAASQDYDSLLFGATLLVRNLTVTGRRKLPGKNVYVNIEPEMIYLNDGLGKLQITREQLVDIGLLVGTDFNEGIKGVGPKTALKLVKKHRSMADILKEQGKEIDDYECIQQFFLSPEVTENYDLKVKVPNVDKIKEFLCEEHDFSADRVEKAIDRLVAASGAKAQKTLDRWFG